jgi:hypothetical protein
MQSTPGRSLAVHQRLYRTLLLAYPRAFRQVYGADMVQVFGDRLRAERERRGRRASIGVWFLTLLDLFKTAPLQRMEKKMTREAAFAVLLAVGLAAAVAIFVAGAGGSIVFAAALGAFIIAALALGFTGAFKKERSKGSTPAGKFSARDWWVVLAGLLGLVQIVVITGQMINDPKWENAVALGIVGGLGALALAGTWFRTRSRSAGDWMIVVGVLPFCALFWAIWPPMLALVVMVMAIIDSTRDRSHAESATEAST